MIAEQWYQFKEQDISQSSNLRREVYYTSVVVVFAGGAIKAVEGKLIAIDGAVALPVKVAPVTVSTLLTSSSHSSDVTYH